jgi:fucose 4-O-acetylase-like acetyltransferase
LVLPYYFSNLFYGILVSIFLSLGLIQFGNKINWHNFFIEPWYSGHQYIFNGPAWFILCLILMQILYALIRKILNLINIKNEYILTVIFFTIGILGTILAENDETRQLYIIWVRVLFGLPFLQLGYLYKSKLEKFDNPSVLSFAILFLIQLLILFFYKDIFGFIVWNGNFNGQVFGPFLTSITGIWLWLQIADILAKKCLNNPVLNYIGNNTSTILFHHYFAFWLLSTMYMLLGAPNFDKSLYMGQFFYKYLYNADKHYLLLYAIAGIVIPLCLKYLFEKFIIPLFKNGYYLMINKFKIEYTDK